MAEPTITKAQYRALLKDIVRLSDKGETRSSGAKLNSYWAIGQRIRKAKLSEKAGYHNSVIRDLAADSGLAIRTLHQSVKFCGEYRKVPKDDGLSWSHYRVLLKLPNKSERSFYINLVQENGWSSRQLSAAIDSGLHKEGQKAKSRLARPGDQSFVFAATVVDVIDGDTVDLDCDLGFGVARKFRARLARIDAPPLKSPQGRKARDFLASQLMQARRVVIKTEKADIYGRYVIHLFTTKSRTSITSCFERGDYVNDLLLAEKHASLIG